MVFCMQGYPTRPVGRPVWRGTDQEAHDLLTAVLHHCTCVLQDDGRRVTTCPPHAMLFTDQRAINGLLFARHMSAQLRAEEFAVGDSAPVA